MVSKKLGKEFVMYRRKGFTLIELLVVIAIIALLMSILMPTLGKARKMAKASMCMSNLKQWGTFFSMYTDDFNGKFMGGRNIVGQNWWETMEPYYKDRKLLLCPMATDPRKVTWNGYGNFGTWGSEWFPVEGYLGSYGLNDWVCNPILKQDEAFQWYGTPEQFWRSTNVKGQATIPLLGDAVWDIGWPEVEDMPPAYPGWIEGIAGEDMAQWAILRHDGIINMLFMDYTVKKVHIRDDLWYLNWHRLSRAEADRAPTFDDFPLWMQKL